MKYTFGLNVKEIQRVRNELLKIKKKLPLMTKDFLEDVALWVIDRANMHLNNSEIGENVKIDIRNGWTYDFTANGIKITNDTDKAVFVEFGVGIVGQNDPHPQASVEGYEYNKDSPYKDKKGTGTWVFKSTLENLDLPQDNVQFAYNNTNSDYAIVTKGAKGVWYAYNAIVDANMELAKVGGGKIGKMWNDVKKRYIK